MQLVTTRRGVTDEEVLSGSLSLISQLVRRHGDTDVTVVVEGVGTADLLERRRRASYARAVVKVEGAWDVDKTLPGTTFLLQFKDAVEEIGWTVASGGGSVLSSISHGLMGAVLKSADTIHVFARERDSDAVAAMVGLRMVAVSGHLRRYEPGPMDPDAVVLDVLTGGGMRHARTGVLVQDIPALPRMPLSESALYRAYYEWGGKLTVDHRVDRVALAEMLTIYTEISGGENDDSNTMPCWSGDGWRSRIMETCFPHGCDRVCQQYISALDRELAHLSPSRSAAEEDVGVYIHGCAPCALHLADLATQQLDDHPSISIGSWSADMQLSLIIPRYSLHPVPHPALHPALHMNLELGCVHLFPVSYTVWWGIYPLIPALDFALIETAFKQLQAVAYIGPSNPSMSEAGAGSGAGEDDALATAMAALAAGVLAVSVSGGVAVAAGGAA